MDPRQQPLLRQRLGVLKVLAWSLVALLVLVYAWLQLVRHGEYRQLALQQAVKVRPSPAPRGLVLDRNGHRLVDNRRALHLVIQREDLPTRPEVVTALAEALVVDPQALARKIQSYRLAGKGRPLVLKENLDEAGIAVAEICRKHGISDATFYTWRSKYGGLEVSDAKRLKSLEEENGKLKKLLAESMLDVATLREALGKNF